MPTNKNFGPSEGYNPAHAADKRYFDPESLGLNLSNEKDLDIWVRSSGDEPLAVSLIAERQLTEMSRRSILSSDTYARALSDADAYYQDRWDELFPPNSPRPQNR